VTDDPLPSPGTLVACHCCGLIQRRPPVETRWRLLCARCHTPLDHGHPARQRLCAGLALAALVFYAPAMGLPMLRLERLGHSHQDSLLSGVWSLLEQGYWLVGGVVLAFSVILPPAKLLALAVLAMPGWLPHMPHRALLYRATEAVGRFGMLDVMLVAILVAFVKLGDLVSIHAGPGLLAFFALVLLSLLATLAFDPRHLWREAP